MYFTLAVFAWVEVTFNKVDFKHNIAASNFIQA